VGWCASPPAYTQGLLCGCAGGCGCVFRETLPRPVRVWILGNSPKGLEPRPKQKFPQTGTRSHPHTRNAPNLAVCGCGCGDTPPNGGGIPPKKFPQTGPPRPAHRDTLRGSRSMATRRASLTPPTAIAVTAVFIRRDEGHACMDDVVDTLAMLPSAKPSVPPLSPYGSWQRSCTPLLVTVLRKVCT
jgi:hypothetical protein